MSISPHPDLQTLSLPEAVIFDWDGTLVNTIPGLRKAHNHVRQSLGFEDWTEEEFRANLRHSSRELYPKLYGDKTDEAFTILYRYIQETHLETLEVLTGAESLLRTLKDLQIPVGLVSNKTHEYLVREVAHLGWEEYFFCVLGAGQAAKDKPAADPLVLAMELGQLSLAPERIWFVGDTETDLMAATSYGCPAVFIGEHISDKALVTQYKPVLVAKGCHELTGIITKMGETLSVKSSEKTC